MSKASEAKALRRGMLVASIEAAKSALKLALGLRDLLDAEDAGRLAEAHDSITGIEQRIWKEIGK